MLLDFAVETQVVVNTDASAARGVALRKGLGKVRHIEVSQLWIQDAIDNRKVDLRKVNTDENLADMFTKHVDRHLLERHTDSLGLRRELGRHLMAPVIDMVDKVEESRGRQLWIERDIQCLRWKRNALRDGSGPISCTERSSPCSRQLPGSRRGVRHHGPDIPLAGSFQLCTDVGRSDVRLDRSKMPRGHFGSSDR